MRTSLPATLDHIRAFEGGWANDPRDPGGCTKYGITLATLAAHGHPRATCAGLRRMGWEEAATIYTGTYWAAAQGDRLPAGIDLLICDHGVNAGSMRAARLLQDVLGVRVDGDIGPKTLAAAGDQASRGLIERISNARRAYYRGLKSFKTFGKGWLRRVDAAENAALKLAGSED